MQWAKRVLQFESENPHAYSPVPTQPHDDDQLVNDEFEREYMFGATRPDREGDVDELLNEGDWLQLRGGGNGPAAATWTLTAFNLASLGVETALLYWYIREVAVFKDDMFDMSLLGTVVVGSVALVTLTAFIALVNKGFRFVELSHWALLVLLPLQILFELAMLFIWTDQTHTTTYTEDDETYTKTITGITRPWLIGLNGGLVALMVATLIANLAVPYDDTRKNNTYKWTIFTCCLLSLLAAVATAVFCCLVLRDVPLLMTTIDGWSVYVAGIASILVAIVMVAGLACARKSSKMVLIFIGLLFAPLVTADVFNYFLSYDVPLTDSTTGTSDSLLYASIISLSSMPIAILAFGTAVMWRRRFQTKHGWPH